MDIADQRALTYYGSEVKYNGMTGSIDGFDITHSIVRFNPDSQIFVATRKWLHVVFQEQIINRQNVYILINWYLNRYICSIHFEIPRLKPYVDKMFSKHEPSPPEPEPEPEKEKENAD